MPDSERIETKALRLKQHGITMYVGALTLRQLASHIGVDYWDEENPGGYQRPLLDIRLREIAEFLTKHEGIFPTALVLSARRGETPAIKFTDAEEVNSTGEIGTLSIPATARLWLVDGQHRFYGALRANEEGNADIADLSFAITILDGLDRFEEMVQFHIINTKDKRVPTDIADRHLVQQFERSAEALTDKERTQARGAIVVDFLHRADGPWKGQIKIPMVKGRTKGLAKQHALVFALDPVLKDAYLGAMDEEDLAWTVNNYWKALERVWPEAFKEPKRHAIQASAGIYALHMLLPHVVQVALSQMGRSGRLSIKAFDGAMEPLYAYAQAYEKRHGANFWARDGGHDLVVATGLGAHRRLAKLLQQQLPKIAIAKEEKVA